MTRFRKFLISIFLLSIVFIAAIMWLFAKERPGVTPLKVGISPYQDIAMLVNYQHLDLERKYNIKLDLRTVAWEDILPAVASRGDALDVGFGSLTEYLTKYEKLNKGNDDPIIFVYPLYVYKGGGFISFKSSQISLTSANIKDSAVLRDFLTSEFGVQKQSIYEMVLFSLARRAGVDAARVKIRDMPMNDSLLAAQNGNIDIAAAGLTQITEARRRDGKVVLSMEDAGFADITGFICRRSILESRRKEIESLIAIWFDCVAHVTSNLETNSDESLAYLRKNSATRYTFEEYRNALDQEYLPRSVLEAHEQLGSVEGRFSMQRIGEDVVEFLVTQKMISTRPPVPNPIKLTFKH